MNYMHKYLNAVAGFYLSLRQNLSLGRGLRSLLWCRSSQSWTQSRRKSHHVGMSRRCEAFMNSDGGFLDGWHALWTHIGQTQSWTAFVFISITVVDGDGVVWVELHDFRTILTAGFLQLWYNRLCTKLFELPGSRCALVDLEHMTRYCHLTP